MKCIDGLSYINSLRQTIAKLRFELASQNGFLAKLLSESTVQSEIIDDLRNELREQSGFIVLLKDELRYARDPGPSW